MAQNSSQRRASDLVAAWLAQNEKNPAWLVDQTGADPGTIGDFLNGVRWPKTGTQGKIEKALGWQPGTIRQIGNGADFDPPMVNLRKDSPTSSAGRTEEADSLLYRRPDGISDSEWDKLKSETRDYLEWLIEKASRER
ncbi:hypothetical protein [Nocardioides aquiterrae]|uniref:XRE family transcriptional regulator n=1 Tax=Nocardioides aquiterrae TaxID=203799 RepID=A0ABN1UEK3_9ACTN